MRDNVNIKKPLLLILSLILAQSNSFSQLSYGVGMVNKVILPNPLSCNCHELHKTNPYSYSSLGGWGNQFEARIAYDRKKWRVEGKLGFSKIALNTDINYRYNNESYISNLKVRTNAIHAGIALSNFLIQKENFAVGIGVEYTFLQHTRGTTMNGNFIAIDHPNGGLLDEPWIYRMNKSTLSDLSIGPRFRFDMKKSYWLLGLDWFSDPTTKRIFSTMEHLDDRPDQPNEILSISNRYLGLKFKLSYFF